MKSFCIECGSALPTQGDGRIVVPAGSLDCDVDVSLSGHIFCGSRANWDDNLEAVTKFEDLPTATS